MRAMKSGNMRQKTILKIELYFVNQIASLK